MWEIFKRAADKKLSEAERALKGWGIKYKKQPDGSILVPGHLDISGRGLRMRMGLFFLRFRAKTLFTAMSPFPRGHYLVFL